MNKQHGRDGHEPDSESKIWRLTGFGVLVFGSGFGVNFSDSAYLCYMLWAISQKIYNRKCA